jgi:hypothetical protein
VQLEGLGKFVGEGGNEIGTQTCDLLACCLAHQPSTLLHAPPVIFLSERNPEQIPGAPRLCFAAGW